MATLRIRFYSLLKEKEIENNRKYTLDDLAVIFNTNKSTLSRMINGLRPIKDDMLKAMANYFNCSTDYLLGNSDIKEQIDAHNINYMTSKNVVSFEEFLETLKEDELNKLSELEPYKEKRKFAIELCNKYNINVPPNEMLYLQALDKYADAKSYVGSIKLAASKGITGEKLMKLIDLWETR